MLAVGTPLFLLVPDSSKTRVLHPGKVVGFDGGIFVVQLDEPMPLAEGTDVVAFACVRNKFLQQGAIVGAQGDAAIENGLTLTLVGEAVSAESRQTYRVSVAVANFKAAIGKETDCQVVDVSPEGFAAIAKAEHRIGSNVQVNFSVEGQTVSAAARVQTVKTRDDGKFRYGFLIAQKGTPARKALQAISAAIQRQQLKRLSAA